MHSFISTGSVSFRYNITSKDTFFDNATRGRIVSVIHILICFSIIELVCPGLACISGLIFLHLSQVYEILRRTVCVRTCQTIGEVTKQSTGENGMCANTCGLF